NGEAWTRICRKMRAELGEDVFSAWFKCLELDALFGNDAYLSVPTKFLKSWIQSHYADKLLPLLTSEFPAVKRLSINVRSSARLAAQLAGLGAADPGSGSSGDSGLGQNVALATSPLQAGISGAAIPTHKKLALVQHSDDETFAGSPLDRR